MKFIIWVLVLSQSKYVMARGKKKSLNILGIYFIPWHIYIKSCSFLSSNAVIV